MIYIDLHSDTHQLPIPRCVSNLPEGGHRLTLRSNVERTEVVVAAKGAFVDTKLFHFVTLPTQVVGEMSIGEYDYTLLKGEVVIASGVAKVIGKGREVVEMNISKTYEQYE